MSSCNYGNELMQNDRRQIVWNDRYLLQYQVIPFLCDKSLSRFGSVSKLFNTMVKEPSIWKDRIITVILTPHNIAHRLGSQLLQSWFQSASIFLKFASSSTWSNCSHEDENNQISLSEQEVQGEWPSHEQIGSLLLNIPNITGWNANNSRLSGNVPPFDWIFFIHHRSFTQLQILQIKFKSDISVHTFSHMPSSLRMLSMQEISHDVEGCFRPHYVYLLARSNLPYLHTLEITLEKYSLNDNHWHSLAKLQHLRRFGLRGLDACSMSFSDMLDQMRRTNFGAKLEVMEILTKFTNSPAAASQEPQKISSASSNSSSQPPVLPELRLLSLAFVDQQPIWPVLNFPRLQTVYVSSSNSDAASIVDLARQGILHYDAIGCKLHEGGSCIPMRFHVLVKPRSAVALPSDEEMLQQLQKFEVVKRLIPLEMRDRILIRSQLPSELSWSSW